MAAAEGKLENSSEFWTPPVKSAYGTVMRAMQSPSPKKMAVSSQLSIGSDIEEDFVIKSAFEAKYRLGRVLGAGASSVVRIGVNVNTQKQYAVKCISKKNLKKIPL